MSVLGGMRHISVIFFINVSEFAGRYAYYSFELASKVGTVQIATATDNFFDWVVSINQFSLCF